MIGLRAHNKVDRLGTALGLGSLGLGDAAGKRDHRPGAVFEAQATDFAIGLFRRFLANVAGVEDDEVGVLALSGSHPTRTQQLGHALAVIDVHLAAERFDSKSLG